MKVYIYKNPQGYYTLMSGNRWPFGRVEGVADTLWGARRKAKRLKPKKALELVEVVDTNE
jgi:hypothetical protein